MPNSLLEKIRNILRPVLGEFVADSFIRVNCDRIGLKASQLTVHEIPKFTDKLKITLFLFLEEKEVEKTIQKITDLAK